MSVRSSAETVAQATIPVPISVSGLTFLNITVKDWVMMGTSILIIFQLIVITPKVIRITKEAYQSIKRRLSK